MLTRDRVTHHESGTAERNRPGRSQRPRCVFFKGTSPRPTGRERGINISGVDFWHAVEFSRNGRFLRTHPRGLSSGRFPSVLRLRLYQIFPIRFPRCFPGSRFRVSLSGASDSIRSFRPDPQSEGGCRHGCWAVPTSPTLARSRGESKIGVIDCRSSSRPPFELNSGTPKSIPSGEILLMIGCRSCGGSAVAEPLQLRGNPKNSTDRTDGCQAAPVKIFYVPRQSRSERRPPASGWACSTLRSRRVRTSPRAVRSCAERS